MENQVAEFVELVEHENYEILTVFPFTIRRKDNHYEISEHYTNNGYLRLNLSDEDRRHTCYKHILIAKQFIPNDDPEHKTMVDHKNKVRDDNRLENLRWVSPSENSINTLTRKGVAYEFVKEIPDESIVVDTYNNHQLENYYFYDDVFYFWTGIEYRILPICEEKYGSKYVNMRSITGKRVQVFYSKFKRIYGLI